MCIRDSVYVVGGVVRDALLGRSAGLTDLDVIVTRAASEVAQRAADRLGWAYYTLDAERDVARLVFTAGKTPLVCDIAAMRGGELTTDLQAREDVYKRQALFPSACPPRQPGQQKLNSPRGSSN